MINLPTTIKLHGEYCNFPMSKIARKDKLIEELEELIVALKRNVSDEIIPEIADVNITLHLYCQAFNYDLDKITRAKMIADRKRFE
jgi:phosphoribosyl-ATP pyrophosphohydrolase